MTHHYTHGVAPDIAWALKEAGMPLKRSDTAIGVLAPTYAEAIDWLMDKGVSVEIQKGVWRGCEWYSMITDINTEKWTITLNKGDWFTVANLSILDAIREIVKP